MVACLSDLVAAGFSSAEIQSSKVYRDEESYAVLTEYLENAADLLPNTIGVVVEGKARSPVWDVANFIGFTKKLVERTDLTGSGMTKLLYAPDLTADGTKCLSSKSFRELAAQYSILSIYGVADGFNEQSADVLSSLLRRRKAAGLTTNLLLESVVVQPSQKELFKSFVDQMIRLNNTPHNPQGV